MVTRARGHRALFFVSYALFVVLTATGTTSLLALIRRLDYSSSTPSVPPASLVPNATSPPALPLPRLNGSAVPPTGAPNGGGGSHAPIIVPLIVGHALLLLLYPLFKHLRELREQVRARPPCQPPPSLPAPPLLSFPLSTREPPMREPACAHASASPTTS